MKFVVVFSFVSFFFLFNINNSSTHHTFGVKFSDISNIDTVNGPVPNHFYIKSYSK